MKKKIINGLLFAVALVAATSSFVSCKDYNGDNYAELQEKYATLQDAFRAQVQAMQDYVLTSRYNAETGYSPELLVAKGTIAKRLEELEKDSAYQAGQISNLDGRLTEYITENNLAVAKAMALAKNANDLAKKDSTLLHKLVIAWGEDLEVAVGKAAEVLVTVAQDSAKWTEAYDSIAKNAKSWNDARDSLLKHQDEWNEAYDSIAKRSKEWNKAVELANKAYDFVKDSKYKNIAELEKAFADADAALAEDIAALQQAVENVLKLVQQQVTGITIQGTWNPVFGTFALPVDAQSNILVTYFGKFSDGVDFPIQGDNEQWLGNVVKVLDGELPALKGEPYSSAAKEVAINDVEGNAGKLYLTINPSDVNFEGKEFTLRTSDNQVSKVVLSDLKVCDEQLKWGWKRAQAAENSANGFYVAKATISADDAKSVALSFDFRSIASDVKAIVKNWRNPSRADVSNLAYDMLKAMQVNAPRLGVQAQWKDALGWKNYVSKYDLAAVSAKPFGFDLLYGADYSEKVYKIRNKITSKEAAYAQEILDMLQFSIDKSQMAGGNIEYDPATGKVEIVIAAGSAVDKTIEKGAWLNGVDIPGVGVTYIPKEALVIKNEKITVDITSLFDGINKAIKDALQPVQTKVQNAVTRVIEVQDKIFGKIAAVAANPNRFLQPALFGESKDGVVYLSTTPGVPTVVKAGSLKLYPTSLTGEVIAPAFKKYIAVLNGGDNSAEGLNEVVDGYKYNMTTPIEMTINAGDELEIVYEALDYFGNVTAKKFFVKGE